MTVKFKIFILISGLFFFAATAAYLSASAQNLPYPRMYFLNIGQGDSELYVGGAGERILTDAGPDSKIDRELSKILPSSDKRLDLVIISHPQRDHYGGLKALIGQYRIGAIALNGRRADKPEEWLSTLASAVKERIPVITLERGDIIKTSDSKIKILNPSKSAVLSGELNDTSIVEKYSFDNWCALLTGDIDFIAEREIEKDAGNCAVLKVPHHGSKYSSGPEFLAAVSPVASIIEVGRTNTYGHPSPEALSRLSFSKIYRTDDGATLAVWSENGKLKIKKFR